MKRSVLITSSLVALTLAGCQKAAHRESAASPAEQSVDRAAPAPMAIQTREAAAGAVAAADVASGPNVAPTAAPGVAFNYAYAFRLPNAKISAVQEEHAQLCEKLGINRCRITGMRYHLDSDNDVSAMLAFKLDPTVARDFGKQGIASVTKAEGMLVDSEISGVDAGGAIADSHRQSAGLEADLKHIEDQLRGPGINAELRAELNDQANTLRQQIRAQADVRTDARASLATTPMVFQYGSGNLVPGFDGASPIREAFSTAQSAFMAMVSFVIIALGVLIPWGALIALLWWIGRRLGLRMPTGARKTITDAADSIGA